MDSNKKPASVGEDQPAVENIYINSKPNHRCLKHAYSAISVCLSSVFFGFILTSSDFFLEHFSEHQTKTKNNETSNIEDSYTLTQNQTSLFTAIVYLGALLGCIIISKCKMELTQTLSLNNFGYGYSIFCIYYANSIDTILMGRFLVGICGGITFFCVHSYLSKLFKDLKHTIFLRSCQYIATSGGFAIGYVFNIGFSNTRDRAMILILLFLVLALSHYCSYFRQMKWYQKKPSLISCQSAKQKMRSF
ncbi:Sugar transporter ERD6-like 12 [Cucumispora dikerogammari]|nr:Sugar transporter ERD6-like 12 [Cucumispora dikerogammari]